MQRFLFPRWNTGASKGACAACVRGSFGLGQMGLFMCF